MMADAGHCSPWSIPTMGVTPAATQRPLDFGWTVALLTRRGIRYAIADGSLTDDIKLSHEFATFDEGVRVMLALRKDDLVESSQVRLVKAGLIGPKNLSGNADGEGQFEESNR